VNRSVKQVISLKECIGDRYFFVPKSAANSFDRVNGVPCVYVSVNGQEYMIPVDKRTPIPYNAFCVLKDIGFLSRYDNFEEGEEIK